MHLDSGVDFGENLKKRDSFFCVAHTSEFYWIFPEFHADCCNTTITRQCNSENSFRFLTYVIQLRDTADLSELTKTFTICVVLCCCIQQIAHMCTHTIKSVANTNVFWRSTLISRYLIFLNKPLQFPTRSPLLQGETVACGAAHKEIALLIDCPLSDLLYPRIPGFIFQGMVVAHVFWM